MVTICGKFIPYNEYTIDHIIPLAKGKSVKFGFL